jgi:3-dehydroquinate dehydratase II
VDQAQCLLLILQVGTMTHILILQGPNLNLLGQREPGSYGSMTLSELTLQLQQQAVQHRYRLSHLQSNAEHELLQAIHEAPTQGVKFIIINPAAFAHTSIALRDALLAVMLPFIEVHITNIYARETFRRHSYLTDIAHGVITGLGTQGYSLALQAAIHYFSHSQKESCSHGHGHT